MCIFVLMVSMGTLLIAFIGSMNGQNFFYNYDIDLAVPIAPPQYPDAFTGILWLDQDGNYANTEVPITAPDLAVGFGDLEHYEYDERDRSMTVRVSGPGWVWMNNGKAYPAFWGFRLFRFVYRFEMSADETFVQIRPGWDLGLFGIWCLPIWVVDWSMTRMPPPPEGSCPPPKGAVGEAVSVCADWERVSITIIGKMLGKAPKRYYVFKIVDAHGIRRQPYFDIFVDIADTTCQPDEDAAWLYGMQADYKRCAKSFTGT